MHPARVAHRIPHDQSCPTASRNIRSKSPCEEITYKRVLSVRLDRLLSAICTEQKRLQNTKRRPPTVPRWRWLQGQSVNAPTRARWLLIPLSFATGSTQCRRCLEISQEWP